MMIANTIDPPVLPLRELLRGFAVIAIVDKRLMIAVVIARHRRWVGSPGRVDNGMDMKTRDNYPIRVSTDNIR